MPLHTSFQNETGTACVLSTPSNAERSGHSPQISQRLTCLPRTSRTRDRGVCERNVQALTSTQFGNFQTENSPDGTGTSRRIPTLTPTHSNPMHHDGRCAGKNRRKWENSGSAPSIQTILTKTNFIMKMIPYISLVGVTIFLSISLKVAKKQQ